MPDLSPDARRILAVFAAATEPIDWYDVVLSLAAEPPRLNLSQHEWQRRKDHLTAELMLLFRDGLLLEPEDGPVDMTVITEAGREALAAGKENAR